MRDKYRSCLVHGKRALFHRWVDSPDSIFKINSVMKPGKIKDKVNAVFVDKILPYDTEMIVVPGIKGLIEYVNDGLCQLVSVNEIIFLDSEDFNEPGKKEKRVTFDLPHNSDNILESITSGTLKMFFDLYNIDNVYSSWEYPDGIRLVFFDKKTKKRCSHTILRTEAELVSTPVLEKFIIEFVAENLDLDLLVMREKMNENGDK